MATRQHHQKGGEMTEYPSDKQDKFMLRLPGGMRDRIKAAAEANGRSMNREIVATLEVAYPEEDVIDALLNDLASIEFFYRNADPIGRRQLATNIVDVIGRIIPKHLEELRSVLASADFDAPDFPFIVEREGDGLKIQPKGLTYPT
jgi:DNA-directed RNA polymerase subunit F